jgi:hypothetical protein
MTDSKSVRVLCIYRVSVGKEDAFRKLLEQHWPTLDGVGLVSPVPPVWYRGKAKDGRPLFIEIFEWKDDKASGVAHETPEVMAVWEPMGALVDDMEFIDIESLASS